MAAHRYWRVTALVVNGNSSYTNISELQFRTTPGGPSVIGGGTPIGYTPVQDGALANAFDGNIGTYCQWSVVHSAWIGYDFGAGNEQDIVEVAMATLSGYQDRAVRFGEVQWSDDGSIWTTLWYFRYSGWTNGVTSVFTLPADTISFRYWEFRSTTPVATTSCGEIELRSSIGGADETGSGTASADSYYSSTYTPAKAFDNDPSTFWSGGGTVTNGSWIRYDFGAGNAKKIVEFTWESRPNTPAGGSQDPTSLWIAASNDQINWLIKGTFAPTLPWSLGQVQTFTIDSAPTPVFTSRRQSLVLN